MRTADIPPMHKNMSTEDQRAFDRRINKASAVMGRPLFSANESSRNTSNEASELIAFERYLQRSGTLSGYQILF